MSLLSLYSLKYKDSVKHKRKLLIYYAVALLTENVNLDISVINNKDKIMKLKEQINIIYGEIKKNEKNQVQVTYLMVSKIIMLKKQLIN